MKLAQLSRSQIVQGQPQPAPISSQPISDLPSTASSQPVIQPSFPDLAPPKQLSSQSFSHPPHTTHRQHASIQPRRESAHNKTIQWTAASLVGRQAQSNKPVCTKRQLHQDMGSYGLPVGGQCWQQKANALWISHCPSRVDSSKGCHRSLKQTYVGKPYFFVLPGFDKC